MTTASDELRPLEITTGELASDERLGVRLKRVAGESGLSRPIRHPRIQKSGLALAGHYYGVVPTRVQILGGTELSYLDKMDSQQRGDAARAYFALGLSCVVLTRDEPHKSLVAAAEATSTPLFVSDNRSSRTINSVHALLDERLAPMTKLHGVLVDVFGIGVLLLGKSGIGKSECALELVLRGHRLVADDIVRCDWRPPGMVFGAPEELLKHHIEIRGLGVLNIAAMFGVTSVNERKRIDLVVRLLDWADGEPFDRLGVDDRYHHILGTPLRELVVPVRPGRDMGTILEIAARNELLRRSGSHGAKDFMARLEGDLLPGRELALEHDEGDARTYAQQQKNPESVVPPSNLRSHPGERTGDSSAYIPAVRPIDRSSEDDITAQPAVEAGGKPPSSDDDKRRS
jgi:HPr kinase/phosphorylase